LVQPDVYWILQTGFVEGQPEFEDDEWVVTMVRRMPGKREAGVVIALMQENDLLTVE
jgi:hypothetical protein